MLEPVRRGPGHAARARGLDAGREAREVGPPADEAARMDAVIRAAEANSER